MVCLLISLYNEYLHNHNTERYTVVNGQRSSQINKTIPAQPSVTSSNLAQTQQKTYIL